MKQVKRVIAILLLMAATVATFVIMGLDKHDQLHFPKPRPAEQTVFFASENGAAVKADGFSLSDDRFALNVGESYFCMAYLDGVALNENVRWSSSNTSVAGVSGDGQVKALAKGEAVITARYSESMEASAVISVYEDAKQTAVTVVRQLAQNGNDEAYAAFTALEQQLRCAKNPSVSHCAAMLSGIQTFREHGAGGGKAADAAWKAITDARTEGELTELDDDTLRRAALTAYCRSELSDSGVTVSFTGDCTFGYFNETDPDYMFPALYRKSGSITYPFDNVKNVFAADDITMINWEGTLTTSKKHRAKEFYFRGEPTYVNILTQASVEAVTVENNHSHDYYDKGYNETLATLRGAKVRYTTAASPAVLQAKDCRIVMLSLSIADTTYLPEYRKKLERQIKQYHGKKTAVVVNIHWGVESAEVPEAWQQKAARSMIDAGADLVIGHHPHVLQGVELYKGRYIFYSLGNFSFGGNSTAARPATMIVRVTFTPDDAGQMKYLVSVIPCYTTSTGSTVNDFRPIPLFGSEGEGVVSKLVTLSGELADGVPLLAWHQIP